MTLFPHTADLGLEMVAPTLRDLFAGAGAALTSLSVEGAIRAYRRRYLDLSALDRQSLFINYLNELIYLLEQERFLVKEVSIERLGVRNLLALMRGETFSPARHRFCLALKAATYHNLLLRREGRRWRARLIIDI